MHKSKQNILSLNVPLTGRDQRGLSLIEVIISTVVLGIAIAGFLMAMSTATLTSRMALDESQLTWLASAELEALRSTDFGNIPFLVTSDLDDDDLIEVPNYFKDLAISENLEGLNGNCQVVSSGDLSTVSEEYIRDYAFDGKRAEYNLKWIGDTNALAYVDTGGGPTVEGPGGGGGPSAGGPGGGPGLDGDFAPSDYQFIYCAFPALTKISRILYDNRFNVSEQMGSPLGGFDSLPHQDDVWQRNFDFFWSDEVLDYGQEYNPWVHTTTSLETFEDQGYQSTGLYVIFDDFQDPMNAGIIGVYNIDTYSDFNINFHWPYVTEIEVYGYDYAANYVEVYDPNTDPAGDKPVQYNNVIMYFQNYRGSGFDLGRRVYFEAPAGSDPATIEQDLIRVDLEFYDSVYLNRSNNWRQLEWWQTKDDEIAKFQTVFYRDEATRVDRLPNLSDLPVHMVYDDGEDILFPFTVPGASEIRGQFGTVNVEGAPTPDTITIEDADGNVYPGPAIGWSSGDLTPWVTGDTLVIHFVSNETGGNSYDSGFTGFEINMVEVKWVGVGSDNP